MKDFMDWLNETSVSENGTRTFKETNTSVLDIGDAVFAGKPVESILVEHAYLTEEDVKHAKTYSEWRRHCKTSLKLPYQGR